MVSLNVRILIVPFKKSNIHRRDAFEEQGRMCGLRPIDDDLDQRFNVLINQQIRTLVGIWCVEWNMNRRNPESVLVL